MKEKTVFVCRQCGYESAKWQGRCPECGEWNTFAEEIRRYGPKTGGASAAPRPAEARLLTDIDADESVRYGTGLSEFDRVLGGGVVPGSSVLLCGDPGIGKSTILLQMCGTLAGGLSVLYFSGEESPRQIKLRANRLGVPGDRVMISSTTRAEDIAETVRTEKPDLVIIDSIQTLSVSGVPSSPGSVTQVRESSFLLISLCKEMEIPVFLVGHITKDGSIAGPKILEHMVDTVLYFEGDSRGVHRILRAVKNRFGSTNEIGVFEMGRCGLSEVTNPSEALLSGRPLDVSGTCATCLMEGSRPILVEIQALAAKSSFGNPRRVSTGFDANRTAMLLAVLEKRGGYFMGNLDVFVNVAGGMKATEPAVDLAVTMAVVGNVLDKVADPSMLMLGEIGLAGEIRTVPHIEARLKEGHRLGFRRFLIPKASLRSLNRNEFPGAELIGVARVGEAIGFLRG